MGGSLRSRSCRSCVSNQWRASQQQLRGPGGSALGREDDEDARVGVEEVPRPDRRQLAIAEEPREREGAEVLADQRNVVIGDTVEALAAPGTVEVAAERRPAAVEGAGHPDQRDLQVLARGSGVAELELERLAHAHAIADGDGAAGLIGAEEVPDEKVAALERRLRRIDGQPREDTGALRALRPA